jgi:hypothetical protein
MSKIAALMAAEAASLAVMASLHLGGRLNGTKPFEPTRAGIAEAIIGVVLAAGSVALLRAGPRAWGVAVAANIFAVGLTRGRACSRVGRVSQGAVGAAPGRARSATGRGPATDSMISEAAATQPS